MRKAMSFESRRSRALLDSSADRSLCGRSILRHVTRVTSSRPAFSPLTITFMALTTRSYSLSAAAKRNSRKPRQQNRNNSINITTDSPNYSGSIILNAYLPDQLTSAYPEIKINKTTNAFLPSPRVPIELLDRIVALMLLQLPFPTPTPPSCLDPFPISCVSTNKFQAVAAFSLASSDFRQVALRRWFEHVHIVNERQWIKLRKFITANEGSGWVK